MAIFLGSGISSIEPVNQNEVEHSESLYAGISLKCSGYLPKQKILTEEKERVETTEANKKSKPKKLYDGYIVGDGVNLRSKPNNKSLALDSLFFNDVVSVYGTCGDYVKVKFGGQTGYVASKYISKKQPESKTFDVPYASMKTWMSYKTITSKGSKQYKLQQIAYTGNYGIRMVNNRYCVALGSHFGCEIGQYFDLILANGTVIPCIMSDQKADIHTDSNNIITSASNCLSEFIVDVEALNSNAKRDGTMSSCTESWNTHVAQIIVYEKVEEI